MFYAKLSDLEDLFSNDCVNCKAVLEESGVIFHPDEGGYASLAAVQAIAGYIAEREVDLGEVTKDQAEAALGDAVVEYGARLAKVVEQPQGQWGWT